jgi:dipeptidase
MISHLIVAIISFVALINSVNGCSNIVVSPGASADSSSLIAYNADAGSLYGMLYHYPAGSHPSGSMRNIYDWDSGNYLGQIDEAPHTYNVVGNVNEYGVIIGETTFGGIGSLQEQKAAKIDYGSLIYVTLQRSRSAREAIHTISDLMAKYGYASEGESFSIADQNEAW